MTGIIDYGLGNVKAFANVYNNLNIPIRIVDQPSKLKNIDRIILPGVGSFDYAMQKLEASGMRQVLDDVVLKDNIPVLGICVGMQILGNSSDEGDQPGLGWIDANVIKFDFSNVKKSLIIPHMGWNTIQSINNNSLFKDLDDEVSFYFLHSYYFQCNKKNDIIAISDYGGEFTCAVNYRNIFGIQFHPEKSHHNGVKLLNNFAQINKG
tara:strand:+ start:376 stop:999 length:624 start_codon:yes stop_codon:yes gene_type:complete